jgi:hypothetical protein
MSRSAGPAWRGQLRAVVGLEWRKGFAGTRSGWILLLAALPVMLAVGHSLAMWRRGEWMHTLAGDSRTFAGLFQLAYLRFSIYLGCAIIFANLFRGDMLDRTLHYYLLAPLRREALTCAKFLAGLSVLVPLFLASVAACYLSLMAHFGPRFQEFLLQGEGLAHLGRYLAVTALAALGYGALFLVVGQIFANPMLPAAVLLAWESINAFLPPPLQKLSVVYYLKSLVPVKLPETGPLAVLAADLAPMPAWKAVLGVLFFSAALLACAAFRARRLEIRYEE